MAYLYNKMNRRKFVQSALLTSPALGATGLATAVVLPLEKRASFMDYNRNPKQQWYELRVYHFANDTQRQLTANYLEQAYLPALNRAGSCCCRRLCRNRNRCRGAVVCDQQPNPPGSIRRYF